MSQDQTKVMSESENPFTDTAFPLDTIYSKDRGDEFGKEDAAEADVICAAFEKWNAGALGQPWHPERVLSTTERERLILGMKDLRLFIEARNSNSAVNIQTALSGSRGSRRYALRSTSMDGLAEVSDWFFSYDMEGIREALWLADGGTTQVTRSSVPLYAQNPSQIAGNLIDEFFYVYVQIALTVPGGGYLQPQPRATVEFAIFDCYQEYVLAASQQFRTCPSNQ